MRWHVVAALVACVLVLAVAQLLHKLEIDGPVGRFIQTLEAGAKALFWSGLAGLGVLEGWRFVAEEITRVP